MTPTERQLVTELFDRLAKLESAERDAQAESLIAAGLARAPNAVYPLVQTVLLQEQALRQADTRIRELETGAADTSGESGFLDGMRETVFGRWPERRGSVPSVPPGAVPPPAAPAAPERGGPSFLGTAAAAAAGVIGGSLLLDYLRSTAASRPAGAYEANPGANTPWTGDAAGGDLVREAGLDDIGRARGIAADDRSGRFETAAVDQANDADFDGDLDIGIDSDFG
jgi:hypothetical protein